jgi:ubiquinone/menaquinone biosynthesis C-methylase UbiE
MDTSEAKAKELKAWTCVAPGWRKHDRSVTEGTAVVSARMLEIAGLQAGETVLDIACGTGEPAIPAAEWVGPNGRVIATDYVAEMIAFAQEKARARGLNNIEFRRVDGEALDLEPASVDLVTSRWGLMFMPDPVTCLTRAHEALRPGGRIVLALWAAPEKNPWAATPMGVIKRHVDIPAPAPGATGIFSFADPARTRSVLEAAGFTDIRLEEITVPMVDFASGAEYFGWISELAGPIAALLSTLSQATCDAIAEEVAAAAEEQSVRKPKVALPGVAWIAIGNRSLN